MMRHLKMFSRLSRSILQWYWLTRLSHKYWRRWVVQKMPPPLCNRRKPCVLPESNSNLLPLLLLYSSRKGFQVTETVLDVVVEDITIKRAGVMHQRIAQVCENLEAICHGLWDNLLRCHNAEQLVIAFWATRAK